MRKIIFRAKSVEKDNLGEWVYGSLVINSDGGSYILPFNCKFGIGANKIDSATIKMSSDIYDRNLTEIYQGDIVRKGDDLYMVVHTHSENPFRLMKEMKVMDGNEEKTMVALIPFQGDEVEVVGNLTDNPELIENDGDK